MSRVFVLGLNAYHGDSSACLLRDGELVAAAEEERFLRVKHWAGFPERAIAYCLEECGISLADLDHVAVNRNPRANFLHRASFVLGHRPARSVVTDRIRNARAWLSLAAEFRARFPGQVLRARFHYVEHHLAHLASAYLVSGFDKAIVLSIDGSGDFTTAAWGLGSCGRVRIEGRVYYPHSLGIFYEALTQYLGFPYFGDEYKVMGLAAYGRPTYFDRLLDVVQMLPDGSFRLNLAYFHHHQTDVGYSWHNTAPSVGRLWSERLASLLGPSREQEEPVTDRHRDIARSVQAVYEAAFFHLLKSLVERYGPLELALAGGCALNSVANGQIPTRSTVPSVYMPPAAGDAGGAIGAAYHVWAGGQGTRTTRMWSAYWGPAYSTSNIMEAIEERRAEFDADGCVIEQVNDAGLLGETAQAIADGLVVGWFQGRMELGPRALGNRSILCDPRRADMKEILNLKIKRRESFRPFAPSVLREHEVEWFEVEADVPFMMQVFPIRKERQAQIPAVTHVDGTGRLQTVHRQTNPRYHALISEFYRRTGVPMVLNTSFNENEPIVCRPEEAIDCFLRTKIDLLVLENVVIRRSYKTDSN